MYKAGDVVVNRRGDVVTLQEDNDEFPRLFCFTTFKMFISRADGACVSDFANNEDFDIVGYAKMTPKADPISPEHYSRLSPEPKDVIRNWDLNFNLGNVIKYIARAGYKDSRIDDLLKAKQYLDFEIEFEKKRLTSLSN